MRGLLMLCVVTSVAVADLASDLDVGDEAPSLRVDTWVKGSSVGEFKRNHVYLVEFWATWCGPCIAGIPHLTELQDMYEDDLTIIGVSTQDTRGNNLSSVKQLVSAQGNRMDYTVAFCSTPTTWADWMGAAGRSSIPSAFLVGPEGKIDWIGHPARVDDALAAAIGRIERRDLAADAEESREAIVLKDRIARALEEDDVREAIGGMSRLVRIDSIRYAGWEVRRLELLLKQNERAAVTQVRNALKRTYKDHPGESAWIAAAMLRSKESSERLLTMIEPDVQRLVALPNNDPRRMMLHAEVLVRAGELENARYELETAHGAVEEAKLHDEIKAQLVREIQARDRALTDD